MSLYITDRSGPLIKWFVVNYIIKNIRQVILKKKLILVHFKTLKSIQRH